MKAVLRWCLLSAVILLVSVLWGLTGAKGQVLLALAFATTGCFLWQVCRGSR